jgi:hypothetical protein
MVRTWNSQTVTINFNAVVCCAALAFQLRILWLRVALQLGEFTVGPLDSGYTLGAYRKYIFMLLFNDTMSTA